MRRPQRGRRGLLLPALLLLATTACSSSRREEAMPNGGGDTTIPATSPAITGTVTAVDGDRIRVEENPADSSGSAKASVRIIAGETRVVRRSGASATGADIIEGSRVSVWFVGPVMESYPVQARGGVVVIE
jgi:hypothetical protein